MQLMSSHKRPSCNIVREQRATRALFANYILHRAYNIAILETVVLISLVKSYAVTINSMKREVTGS